MTSEPISPEDPRLTAYALDEMAPQERVEFARRLENDAAARRAVAEIRETVAALTTALADEPVPVTTAEDPAHSATGAEKKTRRLDGGLAAPEGVLPKVVKFPQFYYMVSGLAAACFAVFFVYWQRNQPVHEIKTYREVPLAAAEGVSVAMPAAAESAGGQASSDEALQKSASLLAQSEEIEKQQKANGNVVHAGKFETEASYGGRQSAKRADRPASPAAVTITGQNAPNNVKKLEEDIVVLTPFSVEGNGYNETSTLAGSRLGTPLTGARAQAPMRDKDLRTFSVRGRTLDSNTEDYAFREDNGYIRAADQPLSTFSADVDTASYANVRRFLQSGHRPPADAVRIEEMVNYFPYDYAGPEGDADESRETAGARRNAPVPFAAHLEVAGAPWALEHRLVRIGLKGRDVSDAARPAANLVFLLDVSGSMNEPNKLPLVRQSMRMLVDRLRPDDRVAIAVYAGASGLALPSTPVSRKEDILEAIDRLQAGGSTNGALGIHLAYDIAKANFVAGGVNRVILATDGDFNVGVTDRGELLRLIREKAGSGVFLSVLGFGMGNLKDGTLEQLADKGNGNYAYIDSLAEARKTLVEQAGGTLVTIAKDVKLQVEFNPAVVQAYRLIGYENRLLAKEDFNNDKIDAGEIGAGHTVTALYEVVPVGADMDAGPGVDPLKYQRPESRTSETRGARSDEMLTVKIRYKEPAGEESRKLEFPLFDHGARFEDATRDFKFAASVAAFGMLLRDSPYKGSAKPADVIAWGRAGLGRDAGGYRSEFIGLVERSEARLR